MCIECRRVAGARRPKLRLCAVDPSHPFHALKNVANLELLNDEKTQ